MHMGVLSAGTQQSRSTDGKLEMVMYNSCVIQKILLKKKEREREEKRKQNRKKEKKEHPNPLPPPPKPQLWSLPLNIALGRVGCGERWTPA